MKKNIVLIGMPGAGKSTIGVLIAKAMNFDFLDTDLLIQQQEKKMLYEIIDEQGMDAFLSIENQVLSNLDVENKIIATGGSAIFGEEAMAHLKEIGTIVYLKLSCQEILRRVKNIKTRGVVMKNGKTLEDVYEERVPLYEKYAEVTIECDNTSIEQCVDNIYRCFQILQNR